MQINKGVFLQTREERNQYKQWEGVERLRKSQFNQNYLDLLDKKRTSNPSADVPTFKPKHEHSRISILSSNYQQTSKSKHSISTSINTQSNLTKLSRPKGLSQHTSSPQDFPLSKA